jgi:Na+/H+ antiporter NhaD/arsenite permease-like protein
VLIDVCARRGFDPVPFLLGLATAANVGSAATLIGNPQNMLVGQSLHLPFGGYLLDGLPPALLGLLAAWWLLARAYDGRWQRAVTTLPSHDPPFDRAGTGLGLVVLTALVAGLVLCPLPREVQALGAGGVLLLSRRRTTRLVLDHVDWQLLVLFAGLFVVNHALQAAGHTAAAFAWLRGHGLDVDDAAMLFATSVVGSNVVSNVPLTMLLLPVAQHPQAGAILCLATTLAGNLLLVGSIANLIVVEQSNRLGVRPVGRRWASEHARIGVPITVVTLAIAAVWLWWRAAA